MSGFSESKWRWIFCQDIFFIRIFLAPLNLSYFIVVFFSSLASLVLFYLRTNWEVHRHTFIQSSCCTNQNISAMHMVSFCDCGKFPCYAIWFICVNCIASIAVWNRCLVASYSNSKGTYLLLAADTSIFYCVFSICFNFSIFISNVNRIGFIGNLHWVFEQLRRTCECIQH